MTTSKTGVSALELQRTLGMGSYQTMWTMLHRFRLAMESGTKDLLAGTVEVDETYFGGPQSGRRGRAALGRTRMQIIPDAKQPL